MEKIAFGRLPLIVRLGALLAFLEAWVMFEEFVIDRQGWDRFLPFYRVGQLCPYDFAALLIMVGVWVMLHRRG